MSLVQSTTTISQWIQQQVGKEHSDHNFEASVSTRKLFFVRNAPERVATLPTRALEDGTQTVQPSGEASYFAMDSAAGGEGALRSQLRSVSVHP